MAVENPLAGLRGAPPAIQRPPLTAVITKRTADGVWAAPLGGDHRTPIGPCRGGDALAVGAACLLVWNQDLPWAIGASTPAPLPGEIRLYAGESAPDGWLPCDGTAVPRDQYPALFAVCGTRYGAGDGATTFNVPDEPHTTGLFIIKI